MRLRYLEMENIRSYIRQRIDFPENTTLFAGDIGVGKSSVLLAIEFALFGMLRGEISGTDILRHGKDRGYVELCFDIGNQCIKIRRNLKRSSKSVVQDAGWLEINGSQQHKTPQEMRAFILEQLGYPQEYLTKNPIMYRYTVYTPQDSMKTIIADKPEARVSILRKVFGIDKYSIIRNNTQTAMTELRAMRRESLALSSGLQEKQQLREKALQEKQQLENSLTITAEKLKDAEKLTEQHEQQLQKAQDNIRHLADTAQKAASLEAQVSNKQQRSITASSEMQELKQQLLSSDDVREPEKPAVDGRFLENEKKVAQGQMQKSLSEASVLQNEISRLKSITEKGVCEFCGQSVADKQHFESEIASRESQKREAEKLLEQSKQRISETENMEKSVTEYRHAKSLYDKSLEEKNNTSKRIIALENEMKESKHFLEQAIQQLQELKSTLKQMPQLEAAEAAAKLVLKRSQDEKLTAASRVSSLKASLSSLEGAIRQYEKEIADKAAAEQKSKKLTDAISWLESLFLPLMERMEQAVMYNIQQEFGSYFQDWFSTLMSEEALSVSVDKDFTPKIEQQGYVTEYSNLSGGEKTAVALAYRLSLNKVINSLVETIKTKDLIILDEPTDGFSYEQLDRIRDVLRKLGLRQTIIVSHEPKIDTFVDNIVRFYKEGHVSKAVAG